ncbi:cytochrome P450 [Chiua virens]|nr:cytochrome P450 [Chiua virens]
MIRVLNQDIIVINSEKIAKDLLERRSSIYSDRPYIATRIPYGWSFNFGFAPYSDHWRTQRRIFHQAFRAEATLAFRPVQLKKARQLILDILSTPRDYPAHIQRFSAAVIMSIVYDYDVAPDHDHLVELFERGNALVSEGLTPETASIIEAFPFLLSIPEWFPGGTFRRKATISNYCATKMIEEPFKHARKREAIGSDTSAVAFDLLRRAKDVDDPSQLQLIKDTCATAFVAGAETAASTLLCFMLAMVQYPEVQKRAHAEIDAVVGRDRLPNFDDRSNLPYIEAILMETMRLYTVAPLALPHAATADDLYEEFYIPKGDHEDHEIWISVDAGSIPCRMHSRWQTSGPCTITKIVYPDPDSFKPERFFVDGKAQRRIQVC